MMVGMGGMMDGMWGMGLPGLLALIVLAIAALVKIRLLPLKQKGSRHVGIPRSLKD